MKNFFNRFILLCNLFVMVLFSEFVRAEEQSPFNEIARERLYVGGLDESDLRVQQVHTAGIKNKPTDTQESNEGF